MQDNSILTKNYRLNQMWDWGHNSKVLRHCIDTVAKTVDGFRENYSREEWDRFWEGYNAPRSRSVLVSIKI